MCPTNPSYHVYHTAALASQVMTVNRSHPELTPSLVGSMCAVEAGCEMHRELSLIKLHEARMQKTYGTPGAVPPGNRTATASVHSTTTSSGDSATDSTTGAPSLGRGPGSAPSAHQLPCAAPLSYTAPPRGSWKPRGTANPCSHASQRARQLGQLEVCQADEHLVAAQEGRREGIVVARQHVALLRPQPGLEER